MNLDSHTQALLLLTARLSKSSHSEAKPLTPKEWVRFEAWLEQEEKTPAQLLESGDPRGFIDGWQDATVTADRIFNLLGQRAALGLVREKWARAGLWVITPQSSDYPAKMKEAMGRDAPPVLIGCGNPQLCNTPAIAVVGSRDASEDDLVFTADYGSVIAEWGYSVVSGGARGVDETAMLGCVDAGGCAIGILADSLLRASTSSKYRNALENDQVVLLSPFNPEAGFNVGNAMARNKYIYACADAAVVIASGKNKGGTWQGAVEALRAKLIPVWVRSGPKRLEGNAALIKRGAHDLGEHARSPADLIQAESTPQEEVQGELFGG